jgi:hypothetical protein
VNTSLTTGIVAACLLAAVSIGMRLRRFLPEHHLSPDSRDTVKLTMGLVATISAVLLGLLVSSAKTSYEDTHAEVAQLAAKFHLLDRVLEIYGSQAVGVRGELHALIESSTRRMWPDEADAPTPATPRKLLSGAYYVALLKLEARDETEHALKAQAVNLIFDIAQLRSLMWTESKPSFSKPMLIVVVLWLVTIFFGFSLIAPPNVTANIALIASAVCAAGAIFLILELNQPFGGLMRISSEPMRNVLRECGK